MKRCQWSLFGVGQCARIAGHDGHHEYGPHPDKAKVLARWRDAEISSAFAAQPGGGKKWMYCVMSSQKAIESRGRHKVANLGGWHFTEQDAWHDAASHPSIGLGEIE
jgi:hypothetical protein